MRVFFLTIFSVIPLFTVGAFSTGCRGPCRQLADKLCDCRTNTIDKQACQQEAAIEEGRATITSADDQICADLLDTCDCNAIDTLEGKQACGLAR